MPPSRLEVEAIESLVAAAEGDFPPSFKLLSGGVAVPGTGTDVESRDDRTLSGGGEEADDDERDLEKACLNDSIGQAPAATRVTAGFTEVCWDGGKVSSSHFWTASSSSPPFFDSTSGLFLIP